jgi:solute:Na+ symporter, SSS family
VNGLGKGAVYALLALGFVVIFKATEVINFAHGSLALIGGYLIAVNVETLGFPLAAALGIGGAGLAWRAGFASLWSPAGAWIGIAVLFFIAGRVRRLAGRTVPEILEARYNPTARLLAMVVTVLAYTVITSYQFRAGGMILHLLTGIPLDTGFLLTALFVITFTALAGMLSVAYTDFVNGVILTLGLVTTLAVITVQAGGWGEIAARLEPGFFAPIHGEVAGVNVFNLMLPTLFLLLGESNIYGRFFSARDSGVATRAVVWWIVGVILIETTVVAIGVAGRALYPNLAEIYPDLVTFGDASEVIIPHMIMHAIHPVLGVLLLATVAAVIVSTATSFLLTPSTNLVHDFWTRFVRRDTSDHTKVWLLRAVVIGLGTWAYLQVAFFENVLQAALYAYTMYGASITPAVLAAFFWKRVSVAGGTASIAAGMVTTLTWQFLVQPALDPAGLGTFNAVIPALLVSTATLVVVSLLTKPPPESRWQPFFRREDAVEDAVKVEAAPLLGIHGEDRLDFKRTTGHLTKHRAVGTI